jgi:hypothetical protein
MDDSRLRSALEIATAILLGLVSVATAAGAYQASAWAEQAGGYTSAAGQLRDESLALNIEAQLVSADDADRIADVLGLEFRVLNGDPAVEEIRAEQDLILRGGSPGLEGEWDRWVDAGFPPDAPPLSDPDFAAVGLAPTYGANRASAVAFELADELGTRSLQLTVASSVFALALLLLGVSGANRSVRVSFALALFGAGVFVIGIGIALLAVVG